MKTKINITKKALEWAIIFGFLCSVFCSFADFDASCEELRNGVLRLHIVANSNSKEDQSLKLQIRDRILEISDRVFETDSNLDEAIKTAKQNLAIYENKANEVIKEAGFNYTATARIGKAFFDTRVYDDFTLPSGYYDSLIIELGEAKGKNWWCVIFPGICVPTEKHAALSDSVGKKGTQIAENSNNYIIRFKTVEIYEKIKKSFKRDS